MDKLNEIVNFLFNKKNYLTVVLFVFALFVVGYCTANYTYPKYQSWQTEKSEIEQKQSEYESLLQKQKQRQMEERKNSMKYDEVPVKIFKSEQPGLPVESASIDFVSTILKMLETTHNSILDISYQIDALPDADKKSIPENTSVVQLVMTLNGTYSSFSNFINTLYNYNYLATIKSMRALPLRENKNILEINVVIWLYVSK